MGATEILSNRLTEAAQAGQYRDLRPRKGIDFCSNDYLGFASDPELRKRAQSHFLDLPSGASGSRLLRGNHPVLQAVEERLAHFCGRETALLFPSGYQANVGLLSALLRDSDIVFSDQINHASIVDGIRLSRARKVIFPHNDLSRLEHELQRPENGNCLRFIVTESVFSMEGDFSPLTELARLASRYDALLIVDESHATGLYGAFDRGQGGGRVQSLGLESSIFASMHTGGKALGVGGAWICGSRTLREYLVNFSRAFIYSTAIVPSVAVLLAVAVEHWKEVGPERANRALSNADLFRSILGSKRASNASVGSPIEPVILGESARALQICQKLSQVGFDVRAIRPPTVPKDSARIRVTFNSMIDPKSVENLAHAIREMIL